MNIEQQFERVTELWSPKVIGRVNDQYVKIAKVRGQFTWHKHDDEDELFLIIKGRLTIQLEDGDIELGPYADVMLRQLVCSGAVPLRPPVPTATAAG